MSTLKVNALDTKSGTTITVAAGKTLAGTDIIDTAQIAANAVDTTEIAAGAVTNAKTDFQPGTIFKGDGSTADGKITLNCSQNTHGVSIQSPAHAAAASYTLTLPTTDGNADEFMQTNGSGVLSWAAVASAGFNSIQTFTSSGTWTRPTDVTKILVFITGGGGGGMYRSGDGGHGGGAAATAIKFLDVSSIASVAVTIGSGGVGGSASDPYNAPAGSASAFGVAPATVHCTAGGGGATSGTGVPGPGGTATGGDANIVGGGGAYNLGGASFWGNGTNSRYSSGYLSPLANGTYGSGGGGARGAASGSGGDGFCLVLEFK